MKSGINLYYQRKERNSTQFGLIGDVEGLDSILNTDLSDGGKLIVQTTSDKASFLIGEGFVLQDNFDGTLGKGISQEIDVEVHITKIKTGKKVFLALLHSGFLNTFILHFLTLVSSTNTEDVYEGGFMILTGGVLGKNLEIGERIIQALENGGGGISFDGVSKCVIRV